MKLLLDEHLSPEIARRLRERGHDVVAVGERAELRGRPDRVHFAALPEQRRTIATGDLTDFRPLLADVLRRGAPTYGMVCVPRKFALSREGIGRLVGALDLLLLTHPETDAAVALGGEIWLQDTTGN